MSTLAERAIEELIFREGGSKYTNRATDRGKATRWGIIETTARSHGYKGSMETLPKEVAVEIYRKSFWDFCKCDQIAKISEELAIWVFDFAVNSSPANAIEPLQGLLNTLNNRQKLYPDFAHAANIGPKTLTSLEAYAKVRDIKVLAYAYNGLRIAFLYNIAKKDESQEDSFYGWLTRVINITANVGVHK